MKRLLLSAGRIVAFALQSSQPNLAARRDGQPQGHSLRRRKWSTNGPVRFGGHLVARSQATTDLKETAAGSWAGAGGSYSVEPIGSTVPEASTAGWTNGKPLRFSRVACGDQKDGPAGLGDRPGRVNLGSGAVMYASGGTRSATINQYRRHGRRPVPHGLYHQGMDTRTATPSAPVSNTCSRRGCVSAKADTSSTTSAKPLYHGNRRDRRHPVTRREHHRPRPASPIVWLGWPGRGAILRRACGRYEPVKAGSTRACFERNTWGAEAAGRAMSVFSRGGTGFDDRSRASDWGRAVSFSKTRSVWGRKINCRRATSAPADRYI